MTPARKSAPPPPGTASKQPAVPHAPTEAQGKPAKRKQPAKATTAPAKTPAAARKPRGGAAASESAKTPPEQPGKPQDHAAAAFSWEAWRADSEASIQVLCDYIADGGNLNDFVKARSASYTTMARWINAEPERAAMYARAREDRSDKLADELVGISDETEVATRYDGEDVKLTLDAAAVARNRLRVDARKWVASKLKPRVYGEKLDLTANVHMHAIPDDELAARLRKFGVEVKLPSQNDEANGA